MDVMKALEKSNSIHDAILGKQGIERNILISQQEL